MRAGGGMQRVLRFSWVSSFRSRAKQCFDCSALVHRAVTIGDLLEGQRQVEHLAGIDLPAPDQIDQLRQESANRGGAAMQVNRSEEQLIARQLHIMEDPDVPYMPAGARGPDGLQHRLLRADR